MAFSPLTALAGPSIQNTTSTGNGAVLHGLVTTVGAQVVVNGTGTGSFLVQGSIDGETWRTLIATSTYANGRTLTSSTFGLTAYVRAQLAAHNSTKDVSIFLAGR